MNDNTESARDDIYKDLLPAPVDLAHCIAWEVEPGLLKMVGPDGTTRIVLVRPTSSK